ncbi:SDR family NAD(P)-dependent oxidoreductase [Neolewinella lacunae]|uniref:SDR family NAD(P)-dependent oxidoreductase n=1 Tax=Neolewinella lacunae TaxID=1517758 RepID=A0A923PLW9_9BACT|nr:SDR family NAD(P)-dependent oxidoreductase [Neolewinella lacunae]MBC6993603.1 SDR family NAD(P)-dependent oxidoreductase [Neolewinella lacunae]MDN3633465.1 SDR family NAD(P)-dependent oxidoreductase [Neolewinella lacunae]
MTKSLSVPSLEWVLVTGGSHGIGRALALECVRRGMAIAVVALPNQDLRHFEEELAATPGTVFATLGLNLVEPGAVETIQQWLQHSDIRLKYLINNAGFGRGGLFENTAWREYSTMLQLNNQVMVELTYALLPELKRTRGGILNLSSVEATLPLPYKSVYTGTKAFVYNYSLALRQEFKHYGISVSVLCPGPVITNEDGLKRVKAMGTLAKIAVTMPEDLAGEAIGGMLRGKDVIRPGLLVKFMAFLGKLFPRRVKLHLLEKMFSKYREAPQAEEAVAVR